MMSDLEWKPPRFHCAKPNVSEDVRYRGKSRKHLLAVRLSRFDTTRTSLRTFGSVSRQRGLLGLGRELDLVAQFGQCANSRLEQLHPSNNFLIAAPTARKTRAR
jgi:hypothetical protein